MFSREIWPFGRELVTCFRDENMAYAQWYSVKLLDGLFGSSNPSVALDKLLHRLNDSHAPNKPFASQLSGERVALRVSLKFQIPRNSAKVLATGGTLVSVQGTLAHHGETVTKNPAL